MAKRGSLFSLPRLWLARQVLPSEFVIGRYSWGGTVKEVDGLGRVEDTTP